jgi:hypothetical protein
MYKDDLLQSLDNIDQPIKKPIQAEPPKETTIQKEEIAVQEETLQQEEEQDPIEVEPPKEKETNWTNLLLGRLK